jgi:hypothetical protein
MTVERFVADLDELVEWVRSRVGARQAKVVIGGLITSSRLTLRVMPTLYP